MKTAERTKYPNLFKGTYWGTFSDKDDYAFDKEIYENRNRFVEEFGIVKQDTTNVVGTIVNSGKVESDSWDHVESYRTKDGKFVIITSVYHDNFPGSRLLGFAIYPKLYHTHATTLVRCFDSKKHITETLKNFTDIVMVIRRYFNLTRNEGRFISLCPFHKGTTPSFIVSPMGQNYSCDVCGVTGDAVKFIMDYEKVDRNTALRMLDGKG